MKQEDLSDYLLASEPHKRERGRLWRTAIGLQKVDGLSPSAYLLETARRNIEGEITLKESGAVLEAYYRAKPSKTVQSSRTEEADKVSQHIVEVLSEPTFSFSPASYITIHRRLFKGVFNHAGRIRDYNITKSEWVLHQDTIRYESAEMIGPTLEYEFSRERNFNYRGLSEMETISHLARFIADVWQIHPFGEGNTRTTAVFAIKYLRQLGFPAANDLFAKEAWYFRNALVRANYTNLPKGIHPTLIYLEQFLQNAVLGKNLPLQNRVMLVGTHAEAESLVPVQREQVREQVGEQAEAEVPRPVCKLVVAVGNETLGVLEMIAALGLGARRNSPERYVTPAIEGGWIERTHPTSPRSPTQKYRLTPKGQTLASTLSQKGEAQ